MADDFPYGGYFQEIHRLSKAASASTPDLKPKRVRRKPAAPSFRVTTEEIQINAADREASARLQTYKFLEKPLPLAPLPKSSVLEAFAARCPPASDLIRDLSLELRFAEKMRCQHMPPQYILLVGPPGCGKSFMANSLANMFCQGALTFCMAGVSSAIDIVSAPRAFRSANPCLPAQAMLRNQRPNPWITCDELDSAGSSDHNGCAITAFRTFLEPETAARYYDQYLQITLDCHLASYIFTANKLSRFDGAFLSRVKLYEIARPGPEHLDIYVASFARTLAKEFGVNPKRIPPADDLLRLSMERMLKRQQSLRDIRRLYETEIKRRALRDSPAATPATLADIPLDAGIRH